LQKLTAAIATQEKKQARPSRSNRNDKREHVRFVTVAPTEAEEAWPWRSTKARGSSANGRPRLGEGGEGVRLRKPISGPKKIYPSTSDPHISGQRRARREI